MKFDSKAIVAVSHIKESHKNWEQIMEDKQGNSKITKFINKKASTVFGWLEWIVMSNLPFVFVESALTRKYSKMEPLSRNSLMKYLRLLTAEVEKMVLNELPEKFGIVIDGWSEGNRHYIAVFACYDLAGEARMNCSPI